MDNIEEARVRPVRPEEDSTKKGPEGKRVVRLRKKRRRWPLFAAAAALLLIAVAVLLPSGEKAEEGVSLSAARELLLEKRPEWKKGAMLSTLREGGFRATPGPPSGLLAVSVTVRRDGLLLRSAEGRNWIPRNLLEE